MPPDRPSRLRRGMGCCERLWVAPSNAPAMDPELLHESVDGEWSFVETLRHLVGTDS